MLRSFAIAFLSLLALFGSMCLNDIAYAPANRLRVAVAAITADTHITVTTTTDELNTDGDCSLREALQAAYLATAPTVSYTSIPTRLSHSLG